MTTTIDPAGVARPMRPLTPAEGARRAWRKAECALALARQVRDLTEAAMAAAREVHAAHPYESTRAAWTAAATAARRASLALHAAIDAHDEAAIALSRAEAAEALEGGAR